MQIIEIIVFVGSDGSHDLQCGHHQGNQIGRQWPDVLLEEPAQDRAPHGPNGIM